MTAQPAQDAYLPLFVSEIIGGPPYDDCLVAGGLMALGCWTNGEVFLNADWTQKSSAERTALLERMRNVLPNRQQTGYLNTGDLDTMVQAMWSYLPPVPKYFDPAQAVTWDEALKLLQAGTHGGLALGNPSRAPGSSKLRRWTNGDDYSHFLWLDRANLSTVLVYNPLAPYGGTAGAGAYEGERIPLSEVKAFCNVTGGKVAISLYRKGDQSTQALVARGLRKVNDQTKAALDKTSAAAKQCAQNLTAANQQIAALKAQLAALPPPADCTDAITAAVNAATAPLTQKLASIKALVEG